MKDNNMNALKKHNVIILSLLKNNWSNESQRAEIEIYCIYWIYWLIAFITACYGDLFSSQYRDMETVLLYYIGVELGVIDLKTWGNNDVRKVLLEFLFYIKVQK